MHVPPNSLLALVQNKNHLGESIFKKLWLSQHGILCNFTTSLTNTYAIGNGITEWRNPTKGAYLESQSTVNKNCINVMEDSKSSKTSSNTWDGMINGRSSLLYQFLLVTDWTMGSPPIHFMFIGVLENLNLESRPIYFSCSRYGLKSGVAHYFPRQIIKNQIWSSRFVQTVKGIPINLQIYFW